MADRRITAVHRNDEGMITALCNPEEEWSPVYRDTVLRHLQTGLFDYYVEEDDYRSYVKLREHEDGDALVTTPAPDSPNNLKNLPETVAAAVS